MAGRQGEGLQDMRQEKMFLSLQASPTKRDLKVLQTRPLSPQVPPLQISQTRPRIESASKACRSVAIS
eukprot:5569986-Amphidinium_carterae.1